VRNLDRDAPSLKVFCDLIFRNESPPDTDMTETRLAKDMKVSFVWEGIKNEFGTGSNYPDAHQKVLPK
jgi:hypothetical protein